MSCASHLRVLGAAALLTAVLLTAWPPVGQAQDGSLSLSGRVVRLTIDGERAVAGERVVLHRVSAREAGPVDSVLTDARGHYAFRVATPDTLAMFLASARYAGIAYFAPPAQAGQDAPPPGEIVVFDTTSRDVPLRVQGR
ncbi:MAG: hypothetical protein ABIZ91_16920, partial [Gemmatimonadaceae bacterium]